MWEAVSENPLDLARNNTSFRGTGLDTFEIVRGLREVCPGIHADWGSRHGLWHPGQNEHQGLFYYHRHLCSIDRGTAPQWPLWDTEEGLKEVSMSYAVMHEDFPVLKINPFETTEQDFHNADTALVMGAVLKDVNKIGWAEVFWRLLKFELPGITQDYLEKRFRISMAWYEQMVDSPITESYNQAESRGWI